MSGSLTRSVSTVPFRSDRLPTTYDHHAYDGCGLVVDALAALTRFRVELGHLEGPLHPCVSCSPGGLATYWTQDLEEHIVAKPSV